MLVIINVKQRLFKQSATQYIDNFFLSRLLQKSGKSQRISCGLESSHPVMNRIEPKLLYKYLLYMQDELITFLSLDQRLMLTFPEFHLALDLLLLLLLWLKEVVCTVCMMYEIISYCAHFMRDVIFVCLCALPCNIDVHIFY